MSETLFKEAHYSIWGLINDIGLPYIQRPFVWANANVRDQFDSMYRGYVRLLDYGTKSLEQPGAELKGGK